MAEDGFTGGRAGSGGLTARPASRPAAFVPDATATGTAGAAVGTGDRHAA